MRIYPEEPMTEEQELTVLEFDMTVTVEQIKQELNEKLMLARKYGYDEFGDEVIRLMEKLNTVRKYGNV